MSTKNKINRQAENVAQRAQDYLKENEENLRRHKLIVRLVVNFPRKFHQPLLSRFALWIVSKQGGQLDIEFGDIRKK